MDTNRLRYFLTVSDYGSIRKASEILRISPAALSKAISVLEKETGYKLIVPNGRGIIVSSKGKSLVERARPILDQLEALSNPDAQLTKHQDSLTVGTFEVFSTYFFGFCLKHHFKQTSVELRELIPGEMEDALLKGSIDVGVTYIPIPSAGVDHIRVGTVNMQIYGKANFEKLPFEKLPFVVPTSPVKGSPTKVQGLDGWPDNRVTRSVKFRVALMESALELCRQGLAVGYFPSFVVELHNKQIKSSFELRPLHLPPQMSAQSHPVYLAKLQTDIENKAIRDLAKALRVGLRSSN